MQTIKEEYVYQVLIFHEDRERLYEVNDDVFEDIWAWCDSSFGTDMWYTTYTEYTDCDIFAFKNESHRDWFVMKWS